MSVKRGNMDANNSNQHASALLTEADIAVMLALKVRTIRSWRERGFGPKFIKFGSADKSPVRYRQEDVQAWIEAQATGGR